MNARLKELKILGIMLGVFLAAYYIPFGAPRFLSGLHEAFFMLQDYARLHVLLCLIPALFIAGAVSVFISKSAVIKYLGPKANKILAYTVASISGAILAVCSCTVLPLFTGIYKRGAGLGPAVAFLYSGPAINVLAIVLTARILGLEIGIARAVGAVVFSI
ncbi:MAG: permease, partial [Candidatus Cloacimonadaceae bacterium]